MLLTSCLWNSSTVTLFLPSAVVVLFHGSEVFATRPALPGFVGLCPVLDGCKPIQMPSKMHVLVQISSHLWLCRPRETPMHDGQQQHSYNCFIIYKPIFFKNEKNISHKNRGDFLGSSLNVYVPTMRENDNKDDKFSVMWYRYEQSFISLGV